MVVPARDAAATLPACLAALAAQHGAVPEVIVVDDGSRDGTAAIAEAWAAGVPAARVARAAVIRQVGRGAAAARNAGARATTAPLILFTDADCVPRPDWALRLRAPFGAPDVAVAMGALTSRQPDLVARLTQSEYADKQAAVAAAGDALALAFADTATAAYRAEVLAALDGFDERLAAVEDTELAFRVAATGARIVYAPDAVVEHLHPVTWRGYAGRKFRFGRWGARAYLAHPRRIAGDGRTPGALRLQLAAAAAAFGFGVAWAAPWLELGLGLGAGLGPGPATRAGSFGALGTAAAMAVLLGSGAPQARRARARGEGWAVVLATPAVVALRAATLGAGLALGTAEHLGAALAGAAGRRAPAAARRAVSVRRDRQAP